MLKVCKFHACVATALQKAENAKQEAIERFTAAKIRILLTFCQKVIYFKKSLFAESDCSKK